MNFIWNVFETANWVISLVLMVLVLLLASYIIFRVVKRKTPNIIIVSTDVLLIISFLLYLPYVFFSALAIYIITILLVCLTNLGDLRKFLANPFSRANTKVIQHKVEKIFDREAMYKEIENAVINLSRTRTGAIITFEKDTSLKDVITNGVAINAPVSAELLETIFYPGTRLHDGAVVIHGNMITAAAVFYTPTTKTFAGKYGSRHRAGIGISEISDAITIIVSEETGRISFAIDGQLETVDQSNFLRVFENYMSNNG